MHVDIYISCPYMVVLTCWTCLVICAESQNHRFATTGLLTNLREFSSVRQPCITTERTGRTGPFSRPHPQQITDQEGEQGYNQTR